VLWGDAIWTQGGGCKGASRSTRAAAVTTPSSGSGSRGVGEAGGERGRGRANDVDLRKRADGADSPKAEPGRQPIP
jgi:hypothetical protein